MVSLTRQAQPPALVLNEPSCYHFRVLDPRLPLCQELAVEMAVYGQTHLRLRLLVISYLTDEEHCARRGRDRTWARPRTPAHG